MGYAITGVYAFEVSILRPRDEEEGLLVCPRRRVEWRVAEKLRDEFVVPTLEDRLACIVALGGCAHQIHDEFGDVSSLRVK